MKNFILTLFSLGFLFVLLDTPNKPVKEKYKTCMQKEYQKFKNIDKAYKLCKKFK